VAAGSGSRLGAGVPKAFVELDGASLLDHALERVRLSGVVDEIVVVVPPGFGAAVPGVHVVPGGATRQASVRAGVAQMPGDVDVVLVHDAARCLAPPGLIASVAAAVRAGHDAVVPGLPVADTIRSLDGALVDRSRLRAVQTPQGFARAVLERAHDDAADLAVDPARSATDDATLVERVGGAVHVVPGHPEAFKVTTPLDLLLAAAVLRQAVTR
jgi:2-C-methyl-D-erythritol 4-phosphate cytidylyltransferase